MPPAARKNRGKGRNNGPGQLGPNQAQQKTKSRSGSRNKTSGAAQPTHEEESATGGEENNQESRVERGNKENNGAGVASVSGGTPNGGNIEIVMETTTRRDESRKRAGGDSSILTDPTSYGSSNTNKRTRKRHKDELAIGEAINKHVFMLMPFITSKKDVQFGSLFEKHVTAWVRLDDAVKKDRGPALEKWWEEAHEVAEAKVNDKRSNASQLIKKEFIGKKKLKLSCTP